MKTKDLRLKRKRKLRQKTNLADVNAGVGVLVRGASLCRQRRSKAQGVVRLKVKVWVMKRVRVRLLKT
jgi:hypothetical protein